MQGGSRDGGAAAPENGGQGSGSGGNTASSMAGLGIQFAGAILLFLWLGMWLDRKLGTAPWLLVVGVFVGAGASFYSMYRKLLAAQREEDDARKRK